MSSCLSVLSGDFLLVTRVARKIVFLAKVDSSPTPTAGLEEAFGRTEGGTGRAQSSAASGRET